MQGAKTFEREVLDRLITMETKIDTITVQCPQCQIKIGTHDVSLATLDASTRSAHHRIDGVYTSAGIVSGIVSAIVVGIFALLNYLSQKGGHG